MTEKILETAVEKADRLIKAFLRGKEVHDLVAKKLTSDLLINGETMSFWKEHFTVKIPHDDLTPAICRDIDLQLMKLNEEACFYYAEANAKLEVINRSGESVAREKFFAIVQDFKDRSEKLPAASTLDKLAKMEGDDLESASSIAQVEKIFWRDILDKIATSRKLIENATWNNKSEIDLNRKWGGSVDD